MATLPYRSVAQPPGGLTANRQAAEATVTGLNGTTGSVATALIASVTSADKRITGSLSLAAGHGRGRKTNLWVRGSGPLDENNSKAPVILGDLKGHRNATLLAAGLNVLRWGWKGNPTAEFALCRRVYSDPALIPDSIRTRFQRELASVATGPTTRVHDSLRLLTRFSETRCSQGILPEPAKTEWETLFDYGRMWFAAVSGEWGRKDYKYADTVGVGYTSTTHQPWTATASAGVYLPKPRLALALMLRAEHAFEAGPPRDYCIPVGTTQASQCRSLPLGAPKQRDPILVSFEARHFVDMNLGLSPRATYDLSGQRGLGLELPILLRQATDKGFTSAMTVGWRSKPLGPDNDERLYVALSFGVTYGLILEP